MALSALYPRGNDRLKCPQATVFCGLGKYRTTARPLQAAFPRPAERRQGEHRALIRNLRTRPVVSHSGFYTNVFVRRFGHGLIDHWKSGEFFCFDVRIRAFTFECRTVNTIQNGCPDLARTAKTSRTFIVTYPFFRQQLW